ncbi:putative cystathionine beta-lyase [Gracilariopsis chorda]|uniref:Putative cystathionine beta-lyase n=1 Tax=Gracilariopsis chorda TaxID=448386 RepID=A0A2V3IR10_9FLOR|nr:putative cystathionine beta-lyase [Gracilariopsis chorda]|eukprot:PXF44539.1 putative cystathionine beta-lyase [Gracilariopsis chorda]
MVNGNTSNMIFSKNSATNCNGKNNVLSEVQGNTRLVHGGVHRDEGVTGLLNRSFINPPVYHASTIVFPNAQEFRATMKNWPHLALSYGRYGNPTLFVLEKAFAAIEDADNACLTSSGVAAINAALLTFLKGGDHLLMIDGVYDATRSFCDGFLARFGVSTTYYAPSITPDDLERLILPNTTVIFIESPASMTFEVADVPELAKRAKAKGVRVIMDNTWGPTLFKPLNNGCDVVVASLTKYVSGHSDLMMGVVAAREHTTYRSLKSCVSTLGILPGPDDAYLALRGLRTLSVRLERHATNGIKVARWLEEQPEVARVMHPGLDSHPQYELFRTSYTNSTGLFGFQLVEGFSQGAVDAMVDGMYFFSLGLSWGGHESLLMETKINNFRTVKKWKYGDGCGQTLRIHVGLEDVSDLIVDLHNGFRRLVDYS